MLVSLATAEIIHQMTSALAAIPPKPARQRRKSRPDVGAAPGCKNQEATQGFEIVPNLVPREDGITVIERGGEGLIGKVLNDDDRFVAADGMAEFVRHPRSLHAGHDDDGVRRAYGSQGFSDHVVMVASALEREANHMDRGALEAFFDLHHNRLVVVFERNEDPDTAQPGASHD